MGHDLIKTEGMDTGYIYTGDRRVIYHISVISYLWNKKINKKGTFRCCLVTENIYI